jgi:hypothetical protein
MENSSFPLFWSYWFWLILTALSLVWYVVMTLYISIRGAFDIFTMLSNLKEKQEDHQKAE